MCAWNIPCSCARNCRITEEAPVYSIGIQAELVTPTGAAIVKTLATRFGAFPAMTIERSGYGAGIARFSGPCQRGATFGGGSCAGACSQDGLAKPSSVLEANLDDLNPQVFGYVMDRLLEEGALDAFGMPVQMKKNRPGTLLTVLCKPEDAEKLTQFIFSETTTLGVRRREEQRQMLARRWDNGGTRVGRRSHQDCQHERNHHELCA